MFVKRLIKLPLFNVGRASLVNSTNPAHIHFLQNDNFTTSRRDRQHKHKAQRGPKHSQPFTKAPTRSLREERGPFQGAQLSAVLWGSQQESQASRPSPAREQIQLVFELLQAVDWVEKPLQPRFELEFQHRLLILMNRHRDLKKPGAIFTNLTQPRE